MAGYLGWKPPVVEMPIVIDSKKEDAEFAEVMREFNSSQKESFNSSDLTGDK